MIGQDIFKEVSTFLAIRKLEIKNDSELASYTCQNGQDIKTLMTTYVAGDVE